MLKLIRKNVFIKDYEEEHFTLETLKLFANKDINLETKKIMLILGIFDVNKVKDLDYCKEQMMKLIRKHVEKEKSALDKEFAEFNQDTESVSDEVSSIKEFLDTVAEDYSIFKDQEIPKDLILYCWPPILAPNPFISFIQSENY
jgi:hypothetical protein